MSIHGIAVFPERRFHEVPSTESPLSSRKKPQSGFLLRYD